MEPHVAALPILIFMSALFSGVETALSYVTPFKVDALLKQGKRGALVLQRVKKNPHRLIATILLSNNLINIGAASLATIIFTEAFGSAGAGIATGVMTFLILIFGELVPKTLAMQHSERISLVAARPLEALSITLTPVIAMLEFISRSVTRVFGSKEAPQISSEELSTFVKISRREGVLSREAARVMENVLEFQKATVRDIMTPQTELETVDANQKLKNAIDFVVRSPYSRFPVTGKDEDEIVGILLVDDVLKFAKNKKLDTQVRKVVRPARFVPETKRIEDLLSEFEGEKIQIAIVVDEYGDVAGLVTIEDILEEIVGEIFDKSKPKGKYKKQHGNKPTHVAATASVKEVNRVLGLDLKAKEFSTIAGFVEQKLQRVPRPGEKVILKNATIEVEKVTKQGIKSVKVIKT